MSVFCYEVHGKYFHSVICQSLHWLLPSGYFVLGRCRKGNLGPAPSSGCSVPQREARCPQGQGWSPGPTFRRDSALLASQLLASLALGGPSNLAAEGWGTEAFWRMVPGERGGGTTRRSCPIQLCLGMWDRSVPTPQVRSGANRPPIPAANKT